MIEIVKDPSKLEEIGKIAWSPSRLEVILTCPRKYYFTYIKKPKIEVPTPFYFARGIFLHKLMEEFFKEDGTPFWKTPESFSDAAGGRFIECVMKTNMIHDREIDWCGRNPFVVRAVIMNTCRAVYDMLVKEGPPIIKPESGFSFQLDRKWYTGKIDAIFPNMQIRDYKTGQREPSKRRLKDMQQFTFYALAYTSLCYADPDFRKAVGVSDEKVEEWKKNNVIISDEITMQYFKLNYKKYRKVVGGKKIEEVEVFPKIIKTSRNNVHYHILSDWIDIAEFMIDAMKTYDKYPPKKASDHCDFCEYAVHCDEEDERVYSGKKDEIQQLYLLKKTDLEKKRKLKQKTFRFLKRKYIDTDLTRNNSEHGSENTEDKKE